MVNLFKSRGLNLERNLVLFSISNQSKAIFDNESLVVK